MECGWFCGLKYSLSPLNIHSVHIYSEPTMYQALHQLQRRPVPQLRTSTLVSGPSPQKCSIAKFHGILHCQAKKKKNQIVSNYHSGLPWWLSGKESACQCRRCRFNHWVRKIPWRRKWQPKPVFLPGKFHGQRSLKDYSPWGRKSRTQLSD